ncbi:MAG: VIT family protein [Porticoccaceae bacterium]|jgi:vacuolar iron transporter family protein|nr:VIT family protein [Porticoccaceae bacterium]
MDHNHDHKSHRIGWLRAAVLGANDGIVSTSSLIIGVAAAQASIGQILIAGLSGLVAGAMSMAAGEYVSVSSQADTEKAELELEKKHLEEHPEFELEELSTIYQNRGLDAVLAKEVARQLMEHDALGAHARDEIGISEDGRAQPIQAALYSAVTFSIGAALPLATAYLIPLDQLIPAVAIYSLIFLAILGILAARAGGASKTIGALRVTFWGALAMAITAGVGNLIGTVI